MSQYLKSYQPIYEETVKHFGLDEEKKKVKATVKNKYPGIEISERSKTVDGYLSPEGGPDIKDHELDILASTYASCRKGSEDKTKCSKIAWSSVNKYRNKSKD